MWNRINTSKWMAGCWFTLLMTFASCRTSQTPTDGQTGGASTTQTTLARIQSNSLQVEKLNAKMNFALNADGKNISVGGTLRMKRDDVIQLSLVAMGFFEAGRIEFTRDSVLVVDRVNQRYLKEAYNSVSFLASANIDFYCLQALFWNQLFVPGQGNQLDAEYFTLEKSNPYHLFEVTESRKLTYRFLTEIASNLLTRTHITTKEGGEQVALSWNYDDFTNVKSHKFPTKMEIALNGLGKKINVNIGLSRFGAEGDWATRTTLSSRYKRVNADEILKQLLSL